MYTYFLLSIVLLFCALNPVQGGRNHHNNRHPNRTSAARTAAGNNRDERALKAFMHRVAVGRAMSCQSDADCSKRGGSKCVADNVKFCGRNLVANIFKAADEQACTVDTDCQTLSGAKKLSYRCSEGKCDFCGPKVCQQDSDCCASDVNGGSQQKCAKSSGYPEKRCWNSCVTKEDCTGSFGLTNVRITCVENVCQKLKRPGNRRQKTTLPTTAVL